jgi:hypothetical protein
MEAVMAIRATSGGAGRRKLQSVPVPVPEHPERVREKDEGPNWLEAGEREQMIAEAAYYRAEARGFQPGNELDDWVVAEREIDALLERTEFTGH